MNQDHYILTAIRTPVNPADPADVEQVRKLQDAIKVSQKAAGTFDALTHIIRRVILRQIAILNHINPF